MTRGPGKHPGGRPSYLRKASLMVEQAIETLGDIRARGDQMAALLSVYGQLEAASLLIVQAEFAVKERAGLLSDGRDKDVR